MKRLPILLLLVLTVSSLFFLVSSTVSHAGDLTSVMLRTDRQKANTATSGTVCATTPNANNGAEAKVRITFPDNFTINSNASNWTTSTSNLPSGGIAWPGIGTATAVSGKEVTFPSSNLTTSTKYCFNFGGTNTLTTGITSSDNNGEIETLTSADSRIDSKNFAVSTSSNDQISVSGTVPATSTDFNASMALTNPSGSTFPQETTLTYTLTYGSNLSYSTNITVEAEWSLGTISGSGTPTVDILDYVIGSASNGYNSTPPVVDTVNRKITWTITSFPGNTSGETVTFQLKTNSSYTGAATVAFDVAGHVLGPGTQTPDSTVTKNYQYDTGVAPTATPTPTSSPSSGATNTPAPGSSATSTPAPTITPILNKFTSIDVVQITDTTSEIYVGTNFPSNISLSFGTSISAMSKTIKSNGYSNQHTITLADLDPQREYFFIVRASSSTNSIITSDIFKFTTAKTSELPKAKFDTLVVTAGKHILIAPNETGHIVSNIFSIPRDSIFEFQIAISKSESIKRVQAFLRNNRVLGIESFAYENEASGNTELVETSPGIYFGRLSTTNLPGVYNVIVKISDLDGNIVEQKIAKIRVLEKFKVVNENKIPIESARVFLQKMDPKTKIYENLSANFSVNNPSYTNDRGEINYILPQGSYRAVISAIGYIEQSVDFIIDTSKNSEYPTITLKYSSFNIISFLEYYISIISDTFKNASLFLGTFAISNRFFDLIAAASLLLLVIACIFALSARTYIPIHLMPQYLIFHTFDLFRITHPKYVSGKIKDIHTGKLISGAKVSLYNADNGKLLSSGYSNKLGEFIIKRVDTDNYMIDVSAHGYHNASLSYPTSASVLQQDLSMEPIGQHVEPPLIPRLFYGIEKLMSFSLELLMLLCLIFEILFLQTLGLTKTLPFILATTITIILWLFYARRVIKRVSSVG